MTGIKIQKETIRKKDNGMRLYNVVLIIIVSILLSTTVYAATVESPTFYDYQGGTFINQLVSTSFGFFCSLNDYEDDAFQQAVNHAVMYANNGEKVEWYRGRASGFAVPVFTWPVNSGYCRRVHIQTYAFNRERTQTATACFRGKTWRWVRSDK